MQEKKKDAFTSTSLLLFSFFDTVIVVLKERGREKDEEKNKKEWAKTNKQTKNDINGETCKRSMEQ